MKRVGILIALFIAILPFAPQAQKASFTTDPVSVKLEGNSRTTLVVTSPANLEAKTRGFTKVNTRRLMVEGTITDGDGIKLFLINNFPVQVFEDGYFSKSVEMKNGENLLDFKMEDRKGFKFEKSYAIKAEFVDANALADEVVSVGPGKYYALLIGENEYYDPQITSLDKPVEDAESLAKIITETYTFDPENVTLLRNATRAEMIDEFARLRKVITPNDNLLLFYAGHGFYDEAGDIGYWIPSDGMKSSTANWFRNSTLSDELGAIKSKHTLLIADACFSGAIFKSRRVFADASIAVNKLYDLPSRKAMTSGALTEVPDRSSFIEYLTKRLEGNSEKYLTSEQLFSSFRLAVINNSDVVPQYGTIQKVGDEGGDFIFIRRD